jgi:feruloyl esterase
MAGKWPDSTTRITAAHFFDNTEVIRVPMFGAPPAEVSVPAHCEVFGVLHERVGALGQNYSIRFHLRLPVKWNRRFFFQGGGGTNGEIGNALGLLGPSVPSAISQSFAVVSQDSGHDNEINSDPTRGGATAFGFDAQARADYGQASLQPVSQAAKELIANYYQERPKFSYFVGCSKGGAEGMAAAQRYPEEFDGIVASAPGMSLPRAALAQAWDVQVLGQPVEAKTAGELAKAFSDGDLSLVSRAVLAACDRDDGLTDGIVGAFERCSGTKVHRQLSRLRCAREKTDQCLTATQIVALGRVYEGPKNASASRLYSDWPWDAGIASFAWRLWKLGSVDGAMPALNITLGGASLSSVFTSPPTELSDTPEAKFAFIRNFDFDRDAQKIYATALQFPRSAWDDISARSPDLSKFRARKGKLVIPHGVSDAVFSINDTIAWFRELDVRDDGAASDFVRVFPVPGMGHCGGGPATDQFNAFGALVQWVETGEAPDRLLAQAGPTTPWPGRQRPLCPYPKIARYKGTGNPDLAESFICAGR